MGNYYNSHSKLMDHQNIKRDDYYKANVTWWENGGYGGTTDDEVMVGDKGGEEDGEEGLAFLDKLLFMDDGMQTRLAVDVGAGFGRVTKLILLKRYQEIRLVEGNEAISKRSKLYLGKKRASKCTFTNSTLQDLNLDSWDRQPIDLIWIQWTLQYLTDADVVECLKKLVLHLRPGVGVLVVKENRPHGTAREDRFQMDTPAGNERYDITRPDAHHRLLFQQANLRVDCAEKGVETNTYALKSN
mmetsp:Transcript_2185/g.2961  ORF Transcript_2185/g.2961 Transcript_2185/m.2961 type:complete len:243 (+) Transcript_2185:226-954(+)